MTWEAPSALAAGAVDERPVLARSRRDAAGVLDAHDRPRRLRPPGRAVPPLGGRRRDLGRGQPALAGDASPPCPYGPYVGGVAVAGRRGASPSPGSTPRTRSGLDSAWAAHAATASAWSAPVRAARFRSLPERFAGDSFRNVHAALARRARARTYLAYAADVGGQADVQLVRSDDGARGARRSRSLVTRRRGSVPAEPRRRRPTTSTSASSTAASARRSSTSGSRPRTITAPRGARSGSRTTPGTRRSARRARRPATCWATTRRWSPTAARRSRWPPTRTWPTTGGATPSSTAARRAPTTRSCSPGPCATGGVISLRGMSTRERIQELADQIVALRDSYYRGSPTWPTRSTTRSRTSCGR